jgi:tRNA A37 threonylcarbamoyladenosine dehydratase
MSTLGEQEVDVTERIARDINPEANIKSFPDGICEHNVDKFLEGVDLYVDAFDFFAI